MILFLKSNWLHDIVPEKQIIFTAHNPAVLDGLDLTRDDIRLFAVDRNSEGHSVINPIKITGELQKLTLQKDWPLSRLWVMGNLGGVPNV